VTPAPRRDAWLAAGVALAARAAVIAWAAARIPAAGDGWYYDVLARRLASGAGYTWAWPDGVVTNVAHYPVGYPALIAIAYAAVGASPAAAMAVNALFGGAMALAAHRLVRDVVASRAWALAAALAVAVHPALVPYTAAIMTEGVAAALLVIAAAIVADGRAPLGRVVAAGVALGVATLVRPQCLALAPFLGLVAVKERRAWSALAMTAAAVAVCLPWTARNCVAMHQCGLVSFNGGWNLLIGAQTTNGAWQDIGVPDGCKTVWDEAAKDACFGAAARGVIAAAPGAWLARVPAKLAMTFDYFCGAPWYLHLANAGAFGDHAKWVLGAVDVGASRLLLLASLFSAAWIEGPRRPARIAIAIVGAIFACIVHAWPAYLALAAAIAALGPRALGDGPVLLPWAAIVVVATAATHAVFFGSGRYGLVVVPWVTLVAFVRRATPMPTEPSESFTSSASSESSSRGAAARS
jgi:hypothetical protein